MASTRQLVATALGIDLDNSDPVCAIGGAASKAHGEGSGVGRELRRPGASEQALCGSGSRVGANAASPNPQAGLSAAFLHACAAQTLPLSHTHTPRRSPFRWIAHRSLLLTRIRTTSANRPIQKPMLIVIAVSDSDWRGSCHRHCHFPSLTEGRLQRTPESLQPKQLSELLHRVLRIRDGMTDRPGVLKDLVVVAALVGLVAEKVDLVPAELLCRGASVSLAVVDRHVAQRIRLVPSVRKDVKRDLTANRERKPIVAKLLLERIDKGVADVVDLVVLFKLDSLLDAGVPADGRDIDHAVPEFDEGAAHDGQIEVGDVLEAELGELLVPFLAEPADEALRGEQLAIAEAGETVFGKDVVELGDKVGCADLELFAHLFEVATTHNADDAVLAELGEESLEFGRDGLACERECAVHVEQTQYAWLLAIRVCAHLCLLCLAVVVRDAKGEGRNVQMRLCPLRQMRVGYMCIGHFPCLELGPLRVQLIHASKTRRRFQPPSAPPSEPR
ncbi:hypothetical protein L1887_48207 [Cichorium endivia]|nr:hypothetical protein L1887_48207 [Cichorium endivia]